MALPRSCQTLTAPRSALRPARDPNVVPRPSARPGFFDVDTLAFVTRRNAFRTIPNSVILNGVGGLLFLPSLPRDGQPCSEESLWVSYADAKSSATKHSGRLSSKLDSDRAFELHRKSRQHKNEKRKARDVN